MAQIAGGGRCSYFHPKKEPNPQRHSDTVRRLRERLEVAGCICEEEAEVKSGRADLVCTCGGETYIFEVKSYDLSGATLNDFFQLGIYCRDARERSPRCILVYRGLFHAGEDKKLVAVEIEPPEQYESLVKEQETKYKPGAECFYCARGEDCPYSLMKLTQIEKPPATVQMQVNVKESNQCGNWIRLYQELLKEEWCLMRHGTSCVSYGGVYVAHSGNVHHKPEEALTRLHIIATALRTGYPLYCGGRPIYERLVEEGLLVEKRCEPLRLTELVIGNIKVEGVLFINKLKQYEFLKAIDIANKLKEIYSYVGKANNDDVTSQLKKLLSDIYSGTCYKTFHGEFVRLVRSTGPLPNQPVVFEAYLLPFIEDIIGSRANDMNTLANLLTKYVGNPKLAESLLSSLTDERGRPVKQISEFQKTALEKLLAQSSDKPLFFLLTAPPGAGKTLVFIVYALSRLLRASQGEGGRAKIVIMYPTKTLAKQQLQLLVYTVGKLNEELGKIDPKLKIRLSLYDGDSRSRVGCSDGDELRGLHCGQNEKLIYRKSGETCTAYCGNQPLDYVTDIEEEVTHANIVVTNPYKLSSALLYGKEWLKDIELVVIDEAHHFLEPDNLDFLTAVLHRLMIRRGSPVDLVFSSATITSSGLPIPADREKLERMTFRAVGGLVRRGGGTSPEAVKKLAELVLGRGLAELYQIEYADYYSQPLLGDAKLTFPIILFAVPTQSPEGLVAEATMSGWIFSLASKERLRKNWNVVVFFDSKSEQKELYRYITKRLGVEELSEADKLLVKPLLWSQNQSAKGKGPLGYEIVRELINSPHSLESFSHLPLLCNRLSDLKKAEDEARNQYRGVASDTGGVLCYTVASGIAEKIYQDSSASHHRRIYIHNADLDPKQRADVEEVLVEKPQDWDVVLSTSTLEMGVNVESIAVVMQFGLPALPENLIQRFGRGGRSRESFHTSLGVLIARHTGEDIALIDEDYATRRLFGFEPRFLQYERSRERVKRIIRLVGFDTYWQHSACGNKSESEQLMRRSAEWLGASALVATEVGGELEHICEICQYIKDIQGTQGRFTISKAINELQKIMKDPLNFLLNGLPPALRNSKTYIEQIHSHCGNLFNTIRSKLTYSDLVLIIFTIDFIRKCSIFISDHQKDLLNNYIATVLPNANIIRADLGKCMVGLLTSSILSEMPHPLIISPPIDLVSVAPGPKQRPELQRRSTEEREGYLLNTPLKLED